MPLLVAFAAVVAVCSAPGAIATAGSAGRIARATGPLEGRWGGMSAAPTAVEERPVSVWTGRLMVVFSRHHLAPTAKYPGGKVVSVAMAYKPGVDRWRRLSIPAGYEGEAQGNTKVVWTGSEVLFWGVTTGALNPVENRWTSLPASPLQKSRFGAGIVVWSGREMIGWGGGCCGDSFADGAAYSPSTHTWRMLARSPLAGAQTPLGAWDGHELLVFVGSSDVNGKPLPASARAAAYNPATDTWRRIAPLPAGAPTEHAVWDGHELLVVGGGGAKTSSGRPASRKAFAFDPATNRWRRLASMESGRSGAAAVWTGKLLLVWGGQTAVDVRYSGGGESATPTHGLAYDPAADRWSNLPPAPLLGRDDPTAVWTGHLMLVWGGIDPYGHPLADGARFRPTTP